VSTLRSQAPSDDWIATHRAVWARKPALRGVYGRWFAALHEACAATTPIVELGCGPGFFKARHPDLIATDAIANPHADAVVEAAALPFRGGCVGGLVLVDVFHHLPRPRAFLEEAARVLRPGGRIAMIEPWVGLAGRLFYRFVHHEECDLHVDPAAPWGAADKGAMEGNAALPWLYFAQRGALDRLGLPLRVVRREPFAALPWLLSGGFQPSGLLPEPLLPAVERVDRLLSAAPRLTAMRCLLVVERTR
jgi:SAM-dependent methyltransferase